MNPSSPLLHYRSLLSDAVLYRSSCTFWKNTQRAFIYWFQISPPVGNWFNKSQSLWENSVQLKLPVSISWNLSWVHVGSTKELVLAFKLFIFPSPSGLSHEICCIPKYIPNSLYWSIPYPWVGLKILNASLRFELCKP